MGRVKPHLLLECVGKLSQPTTNHLPKWKWQLKVNINFMISSFGGLKASEIPANSARRVNGT
jgi:hypothetical protein